MRIEGKVIKDRKSSLWVAEVRALDVMTQGSSYEEALEMLKDAVQELLSFYFKQQAAMANVEVESITKSKIGVACDRPRLLYALCLRREREKQGLSVREVCRLLNAVSPNAYAKYERAEVRPSLTKFEQLIQAINPRRKLILS